MKKIILLVGISSLITFSAWGVIQQSARSLNITTPSVHIITTKPMTSRPAKGMVFERAGAFAGEKSTVRVKARMGEGKTVREGLRPGLDASYYSKNPRPTRGPGDIHRDLLIGNPNK